MLSLDEQSMQVHPLLSSRISQKLPYVYSSPECKMNLPKVFWFVNSKKMRVLTMKSQLIS